MMPLVANETSGTGMELNGEAFKPNKTSADESLPGSSVLSLLAALTWPSQVVAAGLLLLDASPTCRHKPRGSKRQNDEHSGHLGLPKSSWRPRWGRKTCLPGAAIAFNAELVKHLWKLYFPSMVCQTHSRWRTWMCSTTRHSQNNRSNSTSYFQCKKLRTSKTFTNNTAFDATH